MNISFIQKRNSHTQNLILSNLEFSRKRKNCHVIAEKYLCYENVYTEKKIKYMHLIKYYLHFPPVIEMCIILSTYQQKYEKGFFQLYYFSIYYFFP